MTFVTGHRVQTLALIKLVNIDIISPNDVIIMIPDLIKTTKPYSSQPVLKTLYFNIRPEVCPAKCLENYINKTSTLRRDDSLSISFKKPFSKITSRHLVDR